MTNPRVRKIADRIQVIVAEMLERRVKDPRLGFVTVTDVRVTGDSQQATIFFTVLGEEADLVSTTAALESAKGLLRSEVAKQLGMRHAPTLTFVADALPESARHLDEVLARAKELDEEAAARRIESYAGEADPYKKPRDADDEDEDLGVTQPGLVVVDKPGGMTSHDVVARVRRLAGTRKVGHAGTLDPMATGVLVLGIDRATRLLGHLTLTDKRYVATVRLGATTTTDDAEGEVVATSPVDAVTADDVRRVLASFVGEIDQVPSAVSAIKVDGTRAYARVRAGEEVDLPARRITVHAIEVVSTSLDQREDSLDQREDSLDPREDSLDPREDSLDQREDSLDPREASVRLEVHCSSGTYVRAIARDLGAALGVGGHLTALRRTAVGPFTLADSHTLDALGEDFRVVPIADAARASFPALDLDEVQAADVRVGRRLDLALDALTALFAPDGEFLALYREGEDGRARAVAVFTS